jgi:hypothetical protein
VALLSQMFRTVAITGRTDTVNAWFADRQGGRWAEQTVRGAFPNVPSHGRRPAPATGVPADPTRRRRDLRELQQGGVVTEAEAEALRARLSL